MALYREGKAAMAADGTVTGTGTKWQSSLSLIRPGATIMFLSSPIQMAVVNKVVSDTEIKAITTNGAVVASSDYAILLSDSLTVDGLAQDVAETLRYYQSQETVIAEAVDFFKDFDLESLQNLANQVRADSEAADASATAAAASESAAKTSETNAKASEMAAETAIDQVQQIINNAGEQSTLVVLAQTNGFKSIGQVESFNALRSVVPSYAGQRILLASHYEGWNALAHAPFGGGEFVARSGAAIDDGGYTCVPTGQTAFYWQRIPKNPGKVCATEFGLYDGAVLDDILSNSINYCIKKSMGYLSVPALGPAGYTIAGGLEFINSTNGLVIEGPGMGGKGAAPVITHTGANIALTFKRASQAQALFNTVLLKNFSIVGNALATAFVRFSDFYGGSVFDSMIRDYTIGTAIDVYNDKGWTEVIRVDNVVVRTSKRGIWFHSNPASTDWQTVSFYGAKISNFAFQHGIAGASEGIYVGDGSREDNLYNCDIDMMGWWEGGGDSTAIYVADKARIDGAANFRYDGFAASAITSGTQPCRLVKKAGTTGYVKLNCKNYKHEASLGLTAGVTQLTVRPWLAIAEIIAGVATPHPTLPGESIVNVPGMKCKLIGKLFKGQNSVISVVGLPPFHRYKVTTRCNLSSTAQQQYIVNIPNDNNGGITTRTDSVPDVTTNTDTIINGTTAESTSKSTAKNKNFGPIYISNSGGLVDNTYSVTSKQGFRINLDGTHANVVNGEYPVSIEIEVID